MSFGEHHVIDDHIERYSLNDIRGSTEHIPENDRVLRRMRFLQEEVHFTQQEAVQYIELASRVNGYSPVEGEVELVYEFRRRIARHFNYIIL